MAENDTDLDALFAAARQERDFLPEDLAARMLADAQAVQAVRAASETAPEQAKRPGLWSQLGSALGGWRGIGGLATACAAGVWIGLAPPAFLPDPAELLYPQSDTDLFADLSLSDLNAEEG
ncbi:hypothetical protein [Ruegeria sp. HKCCD8929]|uniref:hypothetical protein n=1 Tax=Ruegeria sp. HKCCD8929 TaxID=2683006 RepID=UPI0014891165|nr:hypothetical protein [Ruegeria sp. HKCCD8929]